MKNLLLEMNQLTKENEGALTEDQAKPLIKCYRSLLTHGSKECPENETIAGKRGRTAQSKSRNLLNRLREYEKEALRFLTDTDTPFTNNQGENDIRMSKVYCFSRNRTSLSSNKGIMTEPLRKGKLVSRSLIQSFLIELFEALDLGFSSLRSVGIGHANLLRAY